MQKKSDAVVAEDSPHFTIGETADLLGVSVPTIRMYEREGLIIPVRKASRHRRYTSHDLERIRCIRKTINQDKVSIAGMKRLLALIPCWKIRNCPEDARKKCEAFVGHEAPCWMASKKSWVCKSSGCRTCIVYVQNADCSTLKQTIADLTLSSVRPAEPALPL